jgi:hypothetical protein
MKFIKEWKENRIEFEISNDSTLDEVFEEFQNFLRACGYTIEYNKVLDLVNMDD